MNWESGLIEYIKSVVVRLFLVNFERLEGNRGLSPDYSVVEVVAWGRLLEQGRGSAAGDIIWRTFSTFGSHAMHDENDLIYSPLQQRYTVDGRTVEVCIYRMPDTGWTLEVVDQYNNSTVWDGEFNTDQEAFDLFLEEIKDEGIEAMIGPEPGLSVH